MFNGHQSISGGQFISAAGNVNLSRQKGFESPAFGKLAREACPRALHDSGEISDPPKCHPGTRIDVLCVLVTWARAAIYKYPIRWLNGPAGAGKSAIMRSFAERLVKNGLLLATFFFFRSDPSRNTVARLISTIAYQLCIKMPPLLPWVELAIELNPLIFKASLAIQIQTLITDPFLHYFYNPKSIIISPFPRIILIDGLDECKGDENQQEILNAFCRTVQMLPIPIAIVFASRPEHQIRITLEVGRLSKATSRITLDECFNPDHDIRHFYHIEFEKIRSTHPLRSYLGTPWPRNGVIETLVHNASGQFIYASTVLRFIRSSRHNPALRLQVILGQANRGTSKPFQQLDLLYTAVFLNVDPEVLPDTLRVLGIILTPPTIMMPNWFWQTEGYESPKFLESLLGFSAGHVRSILLDLESLLTMKGDETNIRIFHTSLSDFLFDKSRAGAFFIDRGHAYMDIASACISMFCQAMPSPNLSHLLPGYYLEQQLRVSLQKATPRGTLRHLIISCDMVQLINFQYRNMGGISVLAPLFLTGLKESLYPDAESLYEMKLVSVKRVIHPTLVRHWLSPGDYFRPSMLLVLLFALTPASIDHVREFLRYLSSTDAYGETISILPGLSFGTECQEISILSWGGDDWRLLLRLILDVINHPTGLLHGQRGQQACTDLTLYLIGVFSVKMPYTESGMQLALAWGSMGNVLDKILPFLLNASLVQRDLVKATRLVRRRISDLDSDPGFILMRAAIDAYVERAAEATMARKITRLFRNVLFGWFLRKVKPPRSRVICEQHAHRR